MSDVQNNKRIAKNTLFLSLRMLFVVAVSLYTSRVVLRTLGVEDYGIFNVVAGVVTIFGFISSSMSVATQRYITFALGKGDGQWLEKVFSTTLQIHALIALVIVILGECAGILFLYTKMQLPAERVDAAFWVLQCSILSAAVMIISVPYNATIIAHERMSAFAYISVLEVLLKLAIVYLLVVFSFDKLVLYALLTLVIQILIRFCYSIYCGRHFSETKYHHVWDKALFKEIMTFAGWGSFTGISTMVTTQGLNMLLNVYFGPVVNAARAFAVQVQGTLYTFVSNFQMALNPQITKTYANGEMKEMRKLILRGARFSFYIFFLFSLPLLLETNFILTVWLDTVPENTITFLRIMICTALVYTTANPLVMANRATGRLKVFETTCGITLTLILPISWILLELDFPSYSVFVVHFFLEVVCLLAKLLLIRSSIGIGFGEFLRDIYFRAFAVMIPASVLPCLVCYMLPEGMLRFFIVVPLCVFSVLSSAYLFGLTVNERNLVTNKITYTCKQIFRG